MAEARLGTPGVSLARSGEEGVTEVSLLPARAGGYLASFLHEIEDQSEEEDLTTQDVLIASRLALNLQRIADDQTT